VAEEESIMESLILLALPLSLLLVLMAGVLMFVDVAFRPSRHWSGGDVILAHEAMKAARGIGLAIAPRPVPVAGKLEACRHPEPVPRVTMLEASAIVGELRQRGPVEVERVRTRASAAGCECPLLTESGLCACTLARPLSCLGKCVAGYDVEAGWANGLGDAFSGAIRAQLRNHHLDDEPRTLKEALAALLKEPDSHFPNEVRL
jgi:hypothetical protein